MNILTLIKDCQVEWKPLGEICDVRDGTHDSPAKQSSGKHLITSKNVKNGTVVFDGAYHISEIDFHNINKRSKVDIDDLLFTMIGTVGEIAHVTESPNYAIKNIGLIKTNSNMLSRYLFHYLQSQKAKIYIENNRSKGNQAFLALGKLRAFPIPIPPLEIQEKIVKILDKLTKLTAELTAEHALRKKQCQYYRDFLLDCDNPKNPLLKGLKVEWKTLGEVAEIYGGLTGKSKNDFENGNAKYISYKNIFDNIEVNLSTLDKVNVSENEKQHLVKYGDVLFTGSSETANEAGMSSAVTTKFDENIYLNSFSFGIRFNEGVCIIPEFSKHLFRSHFMRLEIAKTASGVTRFNISKARFKKIKIPIPPLETQAQIVAILDKFDTLTHSISEGLPREIELRQKQYEYYRELLLDFNMES